MTALINGINNELILAGNGTPSPPEPILGTVVTTFMVAFRRRCWGVHTFPRPFFWLYTR